MTERDASYLDRQTPAPTPGTFYRTKTDPWSAPYTAQVSGEQDSLSGRCPGPAKRLGNWKYSN